MEMELGTLMNLESSRCSLAEGSYGMTSLFE